MTSTEQNARDMGFEDATRGNHTNYLLMLQVVNVTDGELSYYWYGWHQGVKFIHNRRRRRK